MSPAEIAAENPQKIAYIMAETGETVTYSELEAAANQGAQLLRSLGLQRGDHIAILLENHPRFFQICWAAQRAGIYYTAISWRLQQQEVEYIVNNCEARVFITSIERKEVVQPLLDKMACVEKSYMLDGVVDGFESWEVPEGTVAMDISLSADVYGEVSFKIWRGYFNGQTADTLLGEFVGTDFSQFDNAYTESGLYFGYPIPSIDCYYE